MAHRSEFNQFGEYSLYLFNILNNKEKSKGRCPFRRIL